ncbi:hypothetical protein [Wenzhouxiangella sp. XN79A]|uniref:hypothetical protein n=1 Tax=Wenzhouxiangella sp. XN79A TaxID=2724193 RepID=UPI00197E5E24|nr:hypothetical protein [Wenzhouxiangella sp. XN79A]
MSGAAEWNALFGHLIRWLGNLRRAGRARKLESKRALRDVIGAVRRTTVILRAAEQGVVPPSDRAELAERWTELGFRLEDLGLSKLAKRCEIRGRLGADPDRFDAEFLERADIQLERIERLARLTLRELDRT